MSLGHGLARFVTSVGVLSLVFVTLVVTSPAASAATLTQTSSTSGTTLASQSADFTTPLAVSGSTGTVTFTTSDPDFTIVGGELESTGPLSVADTPYLITGSDSDTSNDSGSWTFSLTVTPDVIVQAPPAPGTTDVAGSASFTMSPLAASSGFAGPVTFSTSTPGFVVTGNDVLSATESLSATDSPYTITGSDSDAYGDSGAWTYTLTVTPDTIAQGNPVSGSTTPAGSASFTSTLAASSGSVGPVTFATSMPDFAISNGDELQSTGALTLSGSPYVITGTDSDAYGDTGTWTYTLTVATSPVGTTGLVQTSPTSGTVVTTSSSTFTAGPITVEHNVGAVTFVTTKSNPNLAVSTAGLITTTGPLVVGTYSVAGTDSDAGGDSGTWTYTLTVTGAVVTVTFNANGGTGVMSPQSENEPSALSHNSFKRAKYTFVDWNTSANGLGVSYANGTVFPFTEATELFAQWRAGKAPSRTIKFKANGGSGSEASESNDTATAISINHFTRSGYKFVDWNTAANGSGTTFTVGATYAFKASVTLYAQWKKVVVAIISHEVVFVGNGGAGKMSPERHHGSAPLSANQFTRTHFTFVSWNTAANGSGVAYENEAAFSFTSSRTLYAQWKKDKVAISPPPTGVQRSGVPVGAFAQGSSSLTPELQSQVGDLANTVKSEGKTQITLYGYGDRLTVANEHDQSFLAANITLGRMRAQAVATYLEGQLTALGLKGWTISIEATSLAAPGSGNADAATVFAALS
jgi:uncharacterized repeat protein (TIGR02543 family)